MFDLDTQYPDPDAILVAVSGYFDPFHVGHLEYLEQAKKLGTDLIVIVNNDEQAKLKKGESFMNEDDRLRIINALHVVDYAIMSEDKDLSVCKSLKIVRPQIFANGGDRKEEEIPEAPICRELGIKMVDSLGEKIRSSSEIAEQIRELSARAQLE